LQLLIVPVILAGITFLWSASQTKTDHEREDRRIAANQADAEQVREDTTPENYIGQMSDLMLHEKLLSPSGAVRQVGRAHRHAHHPSAPGWSAKRAK
jgi:hypothetical protein